jgi:hypothetical protein
MFDGGDGYRGAISSGDPYDIIAVENLSVNSLNSAGAGGGLAQLIQNKRALDMDYELEEDEVESAQNLEFNQNYNGECKCLMTLLCFSSIIS